MKLLVGLGNIGEEYKDTRHNVGFTFLDYLESKQKEEIKWKNEGKLKAKVAKTRVGDSEALLAKPTTFMNLSGEAVTAILSYYKLAPKDLVVIYDDVDLDLGTIRIREKGSAGTHNGMKSIIEQLGTDEFTRIRIGIESRGTFAPQEQDLHSFVLNRFLGTEKEELKKSLEEAFQKTLELLN